jgi:hypothetical protein
MKNLLIFTLICSLFIFCSQSIAMNNQTTDDTTWDDTIPFDDVYDVISKYGAVIARSSKLFNIPQKIIIGVILTESGGDPFARAETTSAKGLMQTIDSTFEMAYKALKAQGISIVNDPFDPTASILAGSWYLDRMFHQAVLELKADPYERQELRSWGTAIEYYFAGTRKGINPPNMTELFCRGSHGTLKGQRYAGKVIYTASNLFYSDGSMALTGQPYFIDQKNSNFNSYKKPFDKGFE